MTDKWIRIDNTRRVINDGSGKGDYTKEEKKRFEKRFPSIRRVYGLNGKLFPRLTICVRWSPYDSVKGIGIDANYKRNSEAWWDNAHVPLELIDEVKELIDEFKIKLEKNPPLDRDNNYNDEEEGEEPDREWTGN